MPKLRKDLEAILKQYDINPKTALWDCHGTWVMYHKDSEKLAVKAGIRFPPELTRVIEANGESKCVAMVVVGVMGDGEFMRTEWSTGEASPHNYIVKGKQPAYPYAMAEKRGRGRVTLKLVGLYGDVYSEEEADDFKVRAGQDDDVNAPVSPKAGVGVPAEKVEMPPSYELIDRHGEVENVFPNVDAYITTLSTLVREDGSWWENNKDMVNLIGRQAEKGSDLKKHARLLWKMGEEAAANVLEAG